METATTTAMATEFFILEWNKVTRSVALSAAQAAIVFENWESDGMGYGVFDQPGDSCEHDRDERCQRNKKLALR
jgi:hypothetical protein